MPATTEPIIAIIGHPIAGNPSQLAIERSLASLKLEWRVLSFDVTPENVGKAIDGFAVTGIRGVLIDTSIGPAASDWLAGNQNAANAQGQIVDCLYRNAAGKFDHAYQRQDWLDQVIAEYSVEKTHWLGDFPDQGSTRWTEFWRTLGFTFDLEKLGAVTAAISPEPESISEADLVVLIQPEDGRLDHEPLHAENWPSSDGEILVLDLTTNGHPERASIVSQGYRYISRQEIQVGMLGGCIHRWTGQHGASEIIAEAIEEYFAV